MISELLKKDILLQWRQGFWLVYFVVSAIYILVLLNIPVEKRMLVSLILILTDTTVLGVLFIGAMVLLEKQQSVIHSLFVTPLKPETYIWSKTLSLCLIALSMSCLVWLPVWQFPAYILVLLPATAVTAATFVLLGLGISAGLKSVNDYFWIQILFSMLICLPVVPYLLLDRHAAFLFLPYVASLDLMLGVLDPLPAWRIIGDTLFMTIWAFLAFRYARRRVNRKLVCSG